MPVARVGIEGELFGPGRLERRHARDAARAVPADLRADAGRQFPKGELRHDGYFLPGAGLGAGVLAGVLPAGAPPKRSL